MIELLLGYVQSAFSSDDATAVIESCREIGAVPLGQRREGDRFCVQLLLRDARRLLPLLEGRGISYTVTARGGLPVNICRVLRRPFLTAGIVLALALLTISRLFLWEVTVEGLSDVSEAEIREALAAEGIRRGAFIPALDTEAVALSLRESDARIAYISLNRQGTVLSAAVREAVVTPPPTPTAPANLVAAKDGVVTLPLIFEGQAVVREGDAVRAGDLLATGVMDTDNNGIRLTRAAGFVMARTEEVLTVTVPFSYTLRVPTGRVRYEFFLNFFDTERKVFKNSGNLSGGCDIIEKIKRVRAWNGRELPIGWRLLTYTEYTEVAATRTAREALAAAQEALTVRLAEASATRVLLSRTVETVVSDTGITLVCTAVFEEDIARVAEFEADR